MTTEPLAATVVTKFVPAGENYHALWPAERQLALNFWGMLTGRFPLETGGLYEESSEEGSARKVEVCDYWQQWARAARKRQLQGHRKMRTPGAGVKLSDWVALGERAREWLYLNTWCKGLNFNFIEPYHYCHRQLLWPSLCHFVLTAMPIKLVYILHVTTKHKCL